MPSRPRHRFSIAARGSDDCSLLSDWKNERGSDVGNVCYHWKLSPMSDKSCRDVDKI